VKLAKGTTWDALAALASDAIKEQGLWPRGFFPLPHPNHPEGGMLFPKVQIDELKRQTGRDLARFDLDFDLPDHLISEFPAPIYLTTRPDLGDVSKGQLVTIDNLYELFNGILTPKQLDGLRLLVTPFPQQQFNATADRRSEKASLGVACLDCHANGHTNNATHLVGDTRPQEFRHRVDTPTLRGVNIQRLFGSQRALKTVEDFTEFEQRAAYFDGDIVIAVKKGINILDRGHQVHAMAEFQEILDFPPAPKLGVDGRLDPAKAAPEELRGEQVFNGKGRCGTCHQAPYYTDNLMHNLRAERFFKPELIAGRMATADGPIKTFPLRGIKDSPPYLHQTFPPLTSASGATFGSAANRLRSERRKRDLHAGASREYSDRTANAVGIATRSSRHLRFRRSTDLTDLQQKRLPPGGHEDGKIATGTFGASETSPQTDETSGRENRKGARGGTTRRPSRCTWRSTTSSACTRRSG
jgi:cytochrome c peroxidase